MPETVLFEDERRLQTSEVATYLRTVADKLDDDGELGLDAGGESITLTVPDRVEFEVKVEREGPADGTGEQSLELELEWPEDAEVGGGTDDSLSIE